MRFRRPRLWLSLAIVVLVVLVSACTTDSTTAPGPSGSPTPAPSAPTPIPTDPDTTPAPSVPTQTDTDWGRIWDGLPAGFPEFPGAAPSETGEGPASAILDVGDVEPAEVASYYVPALERLGYITVAQSEPLEDGSIEVEWTGEGTCAIRMTATPAGGTTLVEVLYGSDCPFE